MNFIKIAAAAAFVALGASVAIAQTATTPSTPVAPKAPAASTPAPTAPAGTAMAPKKAGQKQATTPEGQACSAEADAKNLHGKDRTKFRNKCIKDMKAAAKGTATTAPAKKN